MTIHGPQGLQAAFVVATRNHMRGSCATELCHSFHSLLGGLGTLSLTVFAWTDLASRLLLSTVNHLLLEGTQLTLIGPEFPREKDASPILSRGTLIEDLILMAYLLGLMFAWTALLALWSRCYFIGSFEWAIAKLLGMGRRFNEAFAMKTSVDSGTGSNHVQVGHSSAMVWFCILNLTWGPTALWTAIFTTFVAPTLEDYYFEKNATNLFWGTVPITKAGDSVGQRERFTLSAQVFVATYVIPVTLCVARMAWLRLLQQKQSKPSQHKGKSE